MIEHHVRSLYLWDEGPDGGLLGFQAEFWIRTPGPLTLQEQAILDGLAAVHQAAAGKDGSTP